MKPETTQTSKHESENKWISKANPNMRWTRVGGGYVVGYGSGDVSGVLVVYGSGDVSSVVVVYGRDKYGAAAA